MVARLWLIASVCLVSLWSQPACEGTAAYSPCEFTFELSQAEASANPNPYVSVELRIEFRSPRFHTFLTPAFWEGGKKMVVRFTPTEPGEWIYRIQQQPGQSGGQAGDLSRGRVGCAGLCPPRQRASLGDGRTSKPHLWMGSVIEHFGSMPGAELESKVAAAAANNYTHLRVSVLGSAAEQGRAFDRAGQPDTAYFDELDQRILAIHKRRMTTDLVLAHDPDALAKLLPEWQSRKRFVRYLVARYAALNITWQGLEEFEGHRDARALLKEIGLALKELDPYQHPRSTNAKITSSPLLQDGWMDFVIDHSSNDQIGAVEHQLYPVPFVAVTTAGRLWNSTMDGQYPVLEGNAGPEAKAWFDFMADTRHWELEPYFDVDAGRCGLAGGDRVHRAGGEDRPD